MKYIFAIIGLLLVARPITLSLSVINKQSINKRLGFIFAPISIKQNYVKLFFGKWNRNFFEHDGKHEISLIVLLLIPFNLLIYVLILIYVVMIAVAGITNNETLLLIAYDKYVFNILIYMIIFGILTTIFTYWSYLWKKQKVSVKEQRESLKDLNKALKNFKNQKWYLPLQEELMKIAYSSNDEKGEYFFKTSQISIIRKIATKSSKNAIFKLKYQQNKPNGFVVLDITNNDTVFQGILKE